MKPTHPTAAQILRSWDKTHTALCKLSAWVTLLRIAAEGEDGISLSRLRERVSAIPERKVLRKYVAAGIIEQRNLGPDRGPYAAQYCRFYITEKGYLFLRLSPTPRSSNRTPATA